MEPRRLQGGVRHAVGGEVQDGGRGEGAGQTTMHFPGRQRPEGLALCRAFSGSRVRTRRYERPAALRAGRQHSPLVGGRSQKHNHDIQTSFGLGGGDGPGYSTKRSGEQRPRDTERHGGRGQGAGTGFRDSGPTFRVGDDHLWYHDGILQLKVPIRKSLQFHTDTRSIDK